MENIINKAKALLGHMNQEQLAEAIGCKRTSLHNKLKGKYDFKLAEAQKIESLFNNLFPSNHV
jgi:DNA-binding XRE family transcriptional regulator